MSADPTVSETAVMPGDGESTREIVRRTEQAVQVMPLMSDDEIRRTWRLAQVLAASHLFKDTNQAESAMAKILIGRDLGLSATRALMVIDLVKGNIQLRGVQLAAWVRQHPDYDYRILEQTDTVCRVRFRRRWEGEWEDLEPVEEFKLEDAQRAGTVKDGSAWKAYPKNMLFWRALSNGVKFHMPELLAGMPVYVEGEIVPDQQITAGHGDGQARNIALPPEVEEILKRAETVGHAGLADRATAEMALDGQPPEFVAEWVKRADRELHEFADSQISDAEVVPDGENGHADTRDGQIKWLRQEAGRTLQLSLQAGEEGDREEATALEHEARRLRAEADTLEAGGQAQGA